MKIRPPQVIDQHSHSAHAKRFVCELYQLTRFQMMGKERTDDYVERLVAKGKRSCVAPDFGASGTVEVRRIAIKECATD